MTVHDLIIIGGGPAAYTAAIYAGRNGLKPIVLESMAYGGQLKTPLIVENFPGFPHGINGKELMLAMRQQAIDNGAKIITKRALQVDLSLRPFKVFHVESDGTYVLTESRAIILAMGGRPRLLGIQGEDQYWNKGVSTSAVTDGTTTAFRDKPIAIVGGGDSACDYALFMAERAKHVYIIVRKNCMRASTIMRERVQRKSNITILFKTVVIAVNGNGEHVQNIIIYNENGQQNTLKVRGLFYAIGYDPNTALLLGGNIQLDSQGFVILPYSTSTQTNIDGVFACGDVVDKRYKQAVVAAGSGCSAAIDAARWLSVTKF